MSARKLDLSTFWPWLQKSTKWCPKKLDLSTSWHWPQMYTKWFQRVRFEHFLALASSRSWQNELQEDYEKLHFWIDSNITCTMCSTNLPCLGCSPKEIWRVCGECWFATRLVFIVRGFRNRLTLDPLQPAQSKHILHVRGRFRKKRLHIVFTSKHKYVYCKLATWSHGCHVTRSTLKGRRIIRIILMIWIIDIVRTIGTIGITGIIGIMGIVW